MARSRRPLTRRGMWAMVVAVLCAVAANMLAARVLVYVALLLVALVLIAVIAVRAPRRDGAVTRRISTDLLAVGETSQVALRFDLRALRVPFGLWRDRLPDAVSGEASGEFPTDNGTSIRYAITGERRGIWRIGPLSLRTTDPFGLVQREQDFGDSRTVIVVPRIVPLAPLRADVGAAGGTAHLSSARLGQGSDNLSPRPYVSGDSMRRIHWRATAHRGDLMVRQEEEESSPDAVVVLDRGAARWAPAGAGADEGFEQAVSACASIALHLEQEGYSVDVIDAAGTALGALRGHEDDHDTLLVALASVVPQGGQRDIAALLDGTPPGPLVVITGALPADEAASLHHGGAAAPVLLATAPGPGAWEAAAAGGWSGAALTEDIAGSWEDALPAHLATGAGRVHG